MADPREIAEILKAAPEVAKAAYSDSVAATLKEISKIGVDAAKTLRLALFPLQFTAALQDRLAAYIDSAVRSVPEPRRIAPQPSVALSICEGLKFCDPAEEVSRLYVALLARAMDKERVGEAHPAFVNIIAQLAPDEIVVIRQLGHAGPVGNEGSYKTYFRAAAGARLALTNGEAEQALDAHGVPDPIRQLVLSIAVNPEELAQPRLYSVFLEHLTSLGLVSYTNEPKNRGVLQGVMHGSASAQLLCIQLSDFGDLFFRACVKENF